MREFPTFLAIGLLNTIVGYGVIFACMYAGMGPIVSNMLGYTVGLAAAYVLNKTYTFKKSNARRGEFLRFVAVVVLAYGVNLLVLIFLLEVMRTHMVSSQIIAGIAYIAVSFLLNKFYVFDSHRRQ